MWAVTCICRHVCHTQAWSCLSTGLALNRCFASFFGTAAVLAQGGGRGMHIVTKSVHKLGVLDVMIIMKTWGNPILRIPAG